MKDERKTRPEEVKEEKVERSYQCMFEKRYCRYANRQGNCFQCEAPSDEAMTCR